MTTDKNLLRASLEKMRSDALAGLLGASDESGCCYVDADDIKRHCAIGCLLPDWVLKLCDENEDLNQSSAHDLVAELKGYSSEPFGLEDLGLSRAQATMLQNWHDMLTDSYSDFGMLGEGRALFVQMLDDLLEGRIDGLIDIEGYWRRGHQRLDQPALERIMNLIDNFVSFDLSDSVTNDCVRS